MRSITAVLLLLAALGACTPLVELEDENHALRARVDSLEILLGEYQAQTELLQERLSAIERENMKLDDRNRHLSARLAEVQYGAPAAEQQGTAQTDGAGEIGAVTPVRLPGQGRTEFRKDTPPDLAFLRKYQSALSAYNVREYARAVRLFTDLLSSAHPNDMIDNCIYWLAESLVQRGQLDEAHARFTAVLDLDGSDKTAAALVARARTAIAMERSAEARADLERCIREFPRSEQAAAARILLKKLD